MTSLTNHGITGNQPAKSLKESQGHFDIHTLEWFIENHKHTATQLRSYEIVWVKKGSGCLTADLSDIEMTANNVYLFRPGQFRHMEPATTLEGYCLSVSADFFFLSGSDNVLSLLQGNNPSFESAVVIAADEELQYEAEEVLVKLSREYAQYATTRTGILKGLFKLFMLYLSQKAAAAPVAASCCSEKELANRFMQSLKHNYATKRSVADYAGELCITPGHLNRIVKKISGFPVSHHIQQQIVLEAKRQAIYSGNSMKQIAYTLGFNDIAHFSKFFKNNSGMSFTSFKRDQVMA